MADVVDLRTLLSGLDDGARDELASAPPVEDWNGSLDVATLPIETRKWIKVPDVVAVVADLKNSTQLGTGKWAQSTASIYRAATGGVVEVFDRFQADFLQIQGDGAFGLFWGDARYERALCAGITIKTYSEALVERLEAKWPTGPQTGFKVGVASNRILVKRIGTPRNPANQEPVWAGKAVNYAAKAAQGADRHEMIVTGSVWDWVSGNDYLAFTCPCGDGPTEGLWSDAVIDRLPDGDREAQGRRLTSTWCSLHGAAFCEAVMSGKRKRDDVDGPKEAMRQAMMRNAIASKASQERRDLRSRRLGATR